MRLCLFFIESETEFIDFELYGEDDLEKIKQTLNKSFDPMAQIINIYEIDKTAKSLDITTQWARYEISALEKKCFKF